ncbi:MAG: hypothetical protein U0905_18465 [Pirellulales bacterium]
MSSAVKATNDKPTASVLSLALHDVMQRMASRSDSSTGLSVVKQSGTRPCSFTEPSTAITKLADTKAMVEPNWL